MYKQTNKKTPNKQTNIFIFIIVEIDIGYRLIGVIPDVPPVLSGPKKGLRKEK